MSKPFCSSEEEDAFVRAVVAISGVNNDNDKSNNDSNCVINDLGYLKGENNSNYYYYCYYYYHYY